MSIMEMLALWPLFIIIILMMYVLYVHTNSIKVQIKYKSFNITTLIYDVFIYMIVFEIIGFCIYYIYCIHRI